MIIYLVVVFFFLILLIFVFNGVVYFWSAFLEVDIEAIRCTESVTGLAIMVEPIYALAAILALPSVALIWV